MPSCFAVSQTAIREIRLVNFLAPPLDAEETADSLLLTLLAEACRSEAVRAAGWRVRPGMGSPPCWIGVLNDRASTPEQGWKLHISAAVFSAQDVLRQALPVLLAENANFKVAASLRVLGHLNCGEGGLSQIGKFITVYPNDDAQAVRLAAALDQATRGLRGPAVPSDRPLAPGSLVHYRYGGFGDRHMQLLFGAVLPDERFVYVYAPAQDSDAMHSSDPLPLSAMNATATTEVCLHSLFVPHESFVKFSSREEMARGDTNNIAGAISPPLGCARGALKVLRTAAQKRKIPFLEETAGSLEAEINACRAEGFRWADGPKDTPEYKPGALAARAWAIELGVRAAHMAVAASSGGANSLDHPAQRLFREAMFYTVIAQTQDIMAATLSRLTRNA